MKTIEAEAIIIPAVEPKIISEVLPVKTNFEDVEAYLSNLVEKYTGLVVTDENQKDMEKTLREVVSIRTGIQKFEINGKRQLKKPVDDFARQCKNLLAIVNSVEAPLKEQLDVYENKRRDELQAAIGREFTAKADTAGLREEYRLFEIPERWFNKTAKWSETCIDIDHVVSDLYSQQVTADNLAELKETRREMGTAYINTVNAEYNLATPLTPDILTDAVLENRMQRSKGLSGRPQSVNLKLKLPPALLRLRFLIRYRRQSLRRRFRRRPDGHGQWFLLFHCRTNWIIKACRISYTKCRQILNTIRKSGRDKND